MDKDHDFLCLGGHIHRNVEFRLDLESGSLFQADYTEDGLNQPFERSSAWFLTPNAIAHAQPKFKVPNPPGYYTLKFGDDRLQHVQRSRARVAPDHRVHAFARPSFDPAASNGFDVLVELVDPTLNPDELELLVTAIIAGRQARGTTLSCGSATQILPPADLDDEAARALVGKKGPVRTCSLRAPWAKVTTVAVRSPGRGLECKVAVEVLQGSGGETRSLRLTWHPLTLKLGR